MLDKIFILIMGFILTQCNNTKPSPRPSSSSDKQTSSGSDANSDDSKPLGLRWMSLGEKSSSSLSSIEECNISENINRSSCTNQNSTCKSKGLVNCDDPAGCRLWFKCTTGTGEGNIWFAGGDGYPTGTMPECKLHENIAGASCTTLEERCLSSFETSPGSHRLFKCLPSGEAGKLLWRWAYDALQANLTDVDECSFSEPLQGKSCTQENTVCKSKFCVGGGNYPQCVKRRLLRCTP